MGGGEVVEGRMEGRHRALSTASWRGVGGPGEPAFSPRLVRARYRLLIRPGHG